MAKPRCGQQSRSRHGRDRVAHLKAAGQRQGDFHLRRRTGAQLIRQSHAKPVSSIIRA